MFPIGLGRWLHGAVAELIVHGLLSVDKTSGIAIGQYIAHVPLVNSDQISSRLRSDFNKCAVFDNS